MKRLYEADAYLFDHWERIEFESEHKAGSEDNEFDAKYNVLRKYGKAAYKKTAIENVRLIKE